MSTRHLTLEDAEAIAAQALLFLSQDKRVFEGFLSVTGLDVSEIASLSEDRQFLAGVLDYTLSQEVLVEDFCESMNLDPEIPWAARQSLPGAPVQR